MKKFLILLAIIGWAIIYISCGGSGDSSSSGTTRVTINLGEVQSPAKEPATISQETTTIPVEVVRIRFTISAPDMVTIQRIIDVAGRTAIIETFEIPNGLNRLIVVEALDANGHVIYRGETTVNLTGRSITVRLILGSTSPPVIQYLDLTVDNVLIENDATTLSFDIINNGNVEANDVLVYVLYSDLYYTTCESLTIPAIAAGSSTNRTIRASYPVYTIYYYKIIVDPLGTIGETEEENNIACDWEEDPDYCSAPPPTSCP